MSEELKEIEDNLVVAIVNAFRRSGATPRQGFLGVDRRDGRFVLREVGGDADALGVLSLWQDADESLDLIDDVIRVAGGDRALAYGIVRGWDGLTYTVPPDFSGEDDRRYFLLGYRVGDRARKELLGA